MKLFANRYNIEVRIVKKSDFKFKNSDKIINFAHRIEKCAMLWC